MKTKTTSERVFHHEQYGPYQQAAAINVKDHGNGLPISIGLFTGDPPGRCDNSMSISMAKEFHDQLGKAIKAAEKAGIKDAGF